MTPKTNNNNEVQFRTTENGFELYSSISSLYSFIILIMVPAILVILYTLINDGSPSNSGQIILFIGLLVLLLSMAIYYSIVRQFVILVYPKLTIGISIGKVKIWTKTVNYRNINSVKYLQGNDADYYQIVLEMKNNSGQVDPSENILFGKYLTLERCKKISWHLNNYLNGVA